MGQISLNNCDAMRELFSASLDGELAELDAARLQAHLAVCSGCSAYAAGAGETSRLLRQTPLEELNFPIMLPGRRLAVARKLQVAAAAAALLATVGLSAAVATLSSGSQARAHSSAKASNLRFPEQELRMLQRASEARSNLANHSRLAL
jgi:predicted anti-sigma-YlaC factor YlaD